MKLFVWDFHGVLEKDNDKAVIEITNEVLRRAGHAVQLSDEQNREYYGLKWYQYFERLLPHLDSEQHKALQAACFVYADDSLDILKKHIKPTEHATDVIRAITDKGHQQIILSNTRPHDLVWFVDTVGLNEHFQPEHIIGVNAHQKLGTKREALADFVHDKTYGDIVIIGDSQKDMDLHDIAGGTTYFYTHPHLPSKQATADHHINDLRDVLKEL